MGEIVRLQKYIAMSGKASRRRAEELIAEGCVLVNGERVTQMGTKVEIGADKVSLNGELLEPVTEYYYIMLNKPVGYLSTVKDDFDRPTVMELVEGEIKANLVPVGRLDLDTEGLLLLSNDGDFVYRVTHPKFNMNKTYIVTMKGGISIPSLRALRNGVVLDDGFRTSPAEVELKSTEKGKTVLQITIHEGKNRQVRRMIEAIGGKVTELRRIRVGEVELGNLPLGRWRHLTKHEINCLTGRINNGK